MVQVENNLCEGRSFGARCGRRLVSYVVICAFLTFVNWMTSPHDWWVLWVIAGWGISILINVICSATGWDTEK